LSRLRSYAASGFAAAPAAALEAAALAITAALCKRRLASRRTQPPRLEAAAKPPQFAPAAALLYSSRRAEASRARKAAAIEPLNHCITMLYEVYPQELPNRYWRMLSSSQY
jgi:hypothetical protein